MKKMKRIFLYSALFSFLFCGSGFNAPCQTGHKVDYLITGDGTSLYVEKSGAGPLCIFVHGGPGAWSGSFEKLKGRNLEKGLTMVYYDQRGCGRSGKSSEGDYSLERMIDDIEALRKHHQADKIYLLSHSFGGILALNYTLKYPEHVQGLILANSTLNMHSSLNDQLQYMNSLLEHEYIPADSTISSFMASFMQAKTALSEKGLDYKTISENKQNVDLLNQIDNASPGNYDFAQNVFQIKDYWEDYSKLTNKVTVPVLVITGKKDYAIGKRHYKSFGFPNKRIKRINGGHLLYYENNEEFCRTIFRFIKHYK
ncbi:alpha/beta fold hydrolase [Niabella terrae]